MHTVNMGCADADANFNGDVYATCEPIVNADCWDLLVSADQYSTEDVRADVFARFLAQEYDASDLTFFLLARAQGIRELDLEVQLYCTFTCASFCARSWGLTARLSISYD